jgi:Ca-activated chloride channel family protein
MPPDWNEWMTIRYHRVNVTLEDQIITTQVDQVFRNDGKHTAEGTYVFPLPPGAIVQNFVMWIDGQPVEGEILSADKAREIYESYVQRRRDPALLEYVGRDAVRARIFPIPAGEERRIELTYTQILPIENGLMHYRYPLDTERFSAKPLEQVSIYAEIKSQMELRAIYSPSHQDEILITQKGAHEATISYETNDIFPNRDFELYISTGTDNIGANLLTHNSETEDGFFMLMLSPAIESTTQHILARDVFLVLDTSGSMDGKKLEQAKAALTYVLEHLNTEDHFNVISFSSDVQTFATTPQPMTEAKQAIHWVNSLEAIGGTNIHLALSETLAQVSDMRPGIVIFLTDGLPTEGVIDEASILDMLKQQAPDSARVFPFGVGYDVNTLFLDQLAEEHKGRPAYVEPYERIDENISAFYAKVQSPLLTNITLDFGDVHTYDLYPKSLTDLYAGTQLIITGRYEGSGTQRLTLTGDVNGEHRIYEYDVTFADQKEFNEQTTFIPRLWAARKIGHLLTQIRLHGENEEWIDAVVTLSLRYGIITPYTSFLVEEPDALSHEGRNRATEEFEKSLEVAPSVSGEQAVEDAEMREGLGGAAAPPPAPGDIPSFAGSEDAESPIRYIRYKGDKTFLCEETRCTDTTYIPDTMQTIDIIFMSKDYWNMLDTHPEWTAYFSLNEETIFVAPDNTVYHFRFGAPEDEIAPPANTETSTPSPTITNTPSESEATSQPTREPTKKPTTGGTTTTPTNSGLCSGTIMLVIASVGLVISKRKLI